MSTAPWFRAARSAATCNRLRNQPLFSWPARRSRRWHGGAGGAPYRVRPCDISKGHDVHKASCDPESSRASGDPRGRGAKEVAFRLGGERGGEQGHFPLSEGRERSAIGHVGNAEGAPVRRHWSSAAHKDAGPPGLRASELTGLCCADVHLGSGRAVLGAGTLLRGALPRRDVRALCRNSAGGGGACCGFGGHFRLISFCA